MGLLDRLFGRTRQQSYHQQNHRQQNHRQQNYRQEYGGPPPGTEDQQAIARYRYLLRTAPPDQIEQAHAEAFAQLTPDQRQQVLGQLAAAVPTSERPRTDDPQTLARVATRAEMRQPGFLERTFGGYGAGGGPGYGRGYGMGGPSFGSMVGGSMLGTIGGLVAGTAIADALFDTGPGDGGLFGGGDEDHSAQEDQGGDYGGDSGWGDSGGGDFGGGDAGGGDFGGGDF
jgi:hypothetical protein